LLGKTTQLRPHRSKSRVAFDNIAVAVHSWVALPGQLLDEPITQPLEGFLMARFGGKVIHARRIADNIEKFFRRPLLRVRRHGVFVTFGPQDGVARLHNSDTMKE